jgi:hypothetical protein
VPLRIFTGLSRIGRLLAIPARLRKSLAALPKLMVYLDEHQSFATDATAGFAKAQSIRVPELTTYFGTVFQNRRQDPSPKSKLGQLVNEESQPVGDWMARNEQPSDHIGGLFRNN